MYGLYNTLEQNLYQVNEKLNKICETLHILVNPEGENENKKIQ